MSIRFRIAPDIRFRIIEDEAVVVRQKAGDVVVLNGVGARVLQLIGDGLSTEEVGDRVAREYDAQEAAIRDDVKAFFGELEALKIIEDDPADGGNP